MKPLLTSLMIIGAMMTYQTVVHAKENRITQDFLAEVVAKARVKFRNPAIAVTVMSSDKIQFQEIQGVRVHGSDEPATLNDYFHIGSCSKSVLGVMAAKLIEEKKIAWSTRFFDIYPELKDEALADYHAITLEDLFLCKAGIKAFTSSKVDHFPEYDDTLKDKRMAFIKTLIKQPPSSTRQKDGKYSHLYSNASYTMASAMLERVSGQDYESLVTQTLTRDMGLAVHIGWPNTLAPEQPWGHQIQKDKIVAFAPEHEYKIPEVITPAGDLSMTVTDYARYTQRHLRGLLGKDDYLTTESYKMLHFGHKGFSLGIGNSSYLGKTMSGFDGSAGTFYCRSLIIPDSDIALTIMTNATDGEAPLEKTAEWISSKIGKRYYNWWWMFWI